MDAHSYSLPPPELFKVHGHIHESHAILKQAASWLTPGAWRQGIPVPSCATLNAMDHNIPGITLAGNIGNVLPSRELIETVRDTLAAHPATGKLLDIGAGKGFLSALFARAGIDVTAVDIKKDTPGYCTIEKLDVIDAILHYPAHAIFLSWPEISKQDGMYSQARAFPSKVGTEALNLMSPGNLLFYIHGREDDPVNNAVYEHEPYLLMDIQSKCEQIGDDLMLPIMPHERYNTLRVFRKLER